MSEIAIKNEQQLLDYGYTDTHLKEIIATYTGVDPYEDYAGAKKALGELVKLRTGLEAARKEKKADVLKIGKAIDGEARRIREIFEGLENPIRDKKDEIDNAAALKEQARIDAIQGRMKALRVEPTELYRVDLDELNSFLLGLSAIEIGENFDEFIHEAKDLKAKAIATVETVMRDKEAQAEQAAAAAKLAEENRALREKMEADQRARAEKDRELQAERDAERKELDKQAEEIRKEAAKIVAQKQAEAERLSAEREAELEAKRVAEMAPDRSKLEALAKSLRSFGRSMPKVKSQEGKIAIDYVQREIGLIADFLERRLGESF